MIYWLALCVPISEAHRGLHKPIARPPPPAPPDLPPGRYRGSQCVSKGRKNLRIMEGLSTRGADFGFVLR